MVRKLDRLRAQRADPVRPSFFHMANSRIMKRLALLVLCLAAFSLRVPSVYGFNLQNFQRLVVFGDSLSDNGNSFVSIGRPQPPYYNGRWTNGANWVDYFSYFSSVNQHFLPATAYLENRGTDFAVAGSNSALLAGQISTYLATTGGRAFANDLYVIWIGANDFLQGLNARITVSDIEAGIVSLREAGARNFLLIDLPDISLTPYVRSQGTATDLAAKQDVYTANAALQAQIPYYALFLGVTVTLVDVNAPFTQLVNTRALTVSGLGTVGFSNSSGSAFNPNTGAVVPNPNSYVFWDGFHPTTLVHYVTGWLIFHTAFPETSSVSASQQGSTAP
jgi:phospholipase/lecithinase/hemolysin